MGYKFAPLVFSGLIPAGGGAPSWKGAVDTEGDLPTVGNLDGDCAVVKATNTIYIWGSGKWNDTSLEEGSFGLASDPNAFAIVTDDTDPLIRRLQIQITPADATNPGAVSTTAQTFAGDKTFSGLIYADGGIDSSTSTLTIGANTANINIGGTGAIITISGNTTYEHVDNLLVKDQTITLNDGGSAGSGAGSGIEVEENGTVTASVYLSNDRASWNLATPVPVGGGTATITPGIGIVLDQSSHDPVTLGAVGSTPNLDGATLTNQVLNLEPADATNPGVVTTTAQTFAGEKTFEDDIIVEGEIDAQSGIDSTSGTLTLGGINTTTVNIGEPATGISSAIFHGPTDHSSYDITNFGQLNTSPTDNQAVVTTVTSSSVNPDYSGLIFSEANPEQADILYTAGGTLNLTSSQNLALTAPNFNVDSANVDIGQLGGTTDLIGGTVTLDSADVNIGQSPGTTDIVGTVTIEYNPVDPTDWAPAPTHVIEAIDQLADRFAGQEQDTKEPTGFVNRTSSTLTFSDSAPARTFTITPIGSFSFYVKGKKFTKTSAESIVISAAAGDHYIYYDDSGVLQESTDPDFVKTIILEYAYVAVVYWNTDTNTHTYFGDERHGIVMDGATHGYLHTVFGARFLSGLALNFLTIPTTVDGTGNSASDAQFPSDQGKIRDEDILHEIPVKAQIPILYRQGSLWRKKTADAYPLIYQGTAGYGAGLKLPYNQFTGIAWQLTEVQFPNKFVLVHYFGTNDIDNPFIGIQGIAEYNSIEDARTNANTEISSLSGLPFTEFVPVGSVIFETATSYLNDPKARIRSTDTGANYVDFRGSQLYTPAGTATTHGLLSGLGNDDHFQYLLADGTRAMSGALDMGTYQINNVVDPTSAQDAATKNYIDTELLGFANISLNNLTTTSINESLIPSTTNSKNLGAASLRWKDIYAIGILSINNINNTTNNTLNIKTINYTNPSTDSGSLSINTGSSTGSGLSSSGNVTIYSGNSVTGNTGTIDVLSGSTTSGNSGDINILTGLSTSGTRGKIVLNGIEIDASNKKIVNVSDPTAVQDAATKNYVDSKGYIGDISRTTFTALDNTTIADDVTDLVFSNAVVRGFDIILTVERDTTYAEYSIKGIQKGASWEISQDYIGDETGITFSITSAGQIQYTTTNTGYNANIKFRAITV